MAENYQQKNSASKWENAGTSGGKSYTPQYAKRSNPAYSPKKTVRSFRDLDVYRIMVECSIRISNELMPVLENEKFPLVEGMRNCSLSIPFLIAEAHGMRFSNFARAMTTIESAMQGCNKMVVYLEQAQGLSKNADGSFMQDMSGRYMQTRNKILRLERAWQKFHQIPR